VIAALIFVVSLAAFGQFGIIYLRAVLISVAAQPLSSDLQEAAGVAGRALRAEDFARLMNLHAICPQFTAEANGLKKVSAYYRAVNMLSRLSGKNLPAFSMWAQQELATCARYAAVVLDQRMAGNTAAAAQLRSY
jgi:hypothetical protein